MARALRVEYPGACYHLMCRGNQSRNIFNAQEDADLFIRTLGEMCVRNQTVAHAWCLMSNHYHLLLGTPQGDLVDAMKWFQGTFTQRYNARHKLWGHLFQGRYKAKVIDDSDSSYFRTVSEYIHLNPVGAGLVASGELSGYLWSSYPLYLSPPSKRPDWLVVQRVLSACGIPDDTLKARRAYAAYMDLRHQSVLARETDGMEAAEWKSMERGWVHGSSEFRRRMMEYFEEQGVYADELEDGDQKRDLSELEADKVLSACLTHFKLTRKNIPDLAKSDPRKLLMAGLLRYHFPVRAQWVAERLGMGHFTTVSRAMRFYDEAGGLWAKEKQRILKFIG